MKDSELNDRAGVLLILFSIVLLKKLNYPVRPEVSGSESEILNQCCVGNWKWLRYSNTNNNNITSDTNT